MRFAGGDGLGNFSRLATLGLCLSTLASAESTQPLSITFNSEFLGYDGQWSTAQILVGSPQQWLSVLPSTTNSEAWVVGPAGCDGTSTCASLRGGLFNADQSKMWQELGLYQLGYSTLSQHTDNGNYGLDSLAFSDSVTIPNQIFAVVNNTNHWIGRLGLVVQDTRFQNTTNYLPFISTLVQNESLVPSHSYGYTAGASYKGKGVLGSLTVGGIDTTRYTPNNVTFSLAPGYIPSLVVNSMSVYAPNRPSNWKANPLSLLSSDQAAVFTIDSDTPFLWFPEATCDNIAQALNLTWNESVELYTFANSSQPQSLLSQNIHFTFGLANSAGVSTELSLNISYNAFHLQLSYPFPGLFPSYSDAKVNYFPLRRANSSNQYTIGRSFLQEAYLTVDYERNNFSLSQALYPDSSQPAVLSTISRPLNSTWPGPHAQHASSPISMGAVAGVVVAMVIVIVAIGTSSWWLCTRRGKHSQRLDDEPRRSRFAILSIFSRFSKESSKTVLTAELHADKRHPGEMGADMSNSRYEMTSVVPIEMAAANVSPTYFQPRTHAHIPQLNDPRSPLELPNPRRRTSTEKQDLEQMEERPSSPAPAYSPVRTDDQSNSISPYTPIGPNAFQEGSDQAVSPVKVPSNGHNENDGRLQP